MEFKDRDSTAFDDILSFIQQHPDFEKLEMDSEPVLSLPGLEINFSRRKVVSNNREVKLTTKEYEILCLLATNKGRVLTYSQIYDKVWGDTAFGNESKAVGYHIWSLRKKLCKSENSPPIVNENVREVGYRLEINS